MGQSKPFCRYALIVEDDPDQRSLAAALFEESDLHVLEVETAEEALYLMCRHGADVAFLFVDIGLPGSLDGVDLARTVARVWPATRVMVTSGLPPLEPLPENAGFMPKPWRALDLLIEGERASSVPGTCEETALGRHEEAGTMASLGEGRKRDGRNRQTHNPRIRS